MCNAPLISNLSQSSCNRFSALPLQPLDGLDLARESPSHTLLPSCGFTYVFKVLVQYSQVRLITCLKRPRLCAKFIFSSNNRTFALQLKDEKMRVRPPLIMLHPAVCRENGIANYLAMAGSVGAVIRLYAVYSIL